MLQESSATMTAPSMHVTYPPASLLHFPPASDPSALYPPQSDHTFARPFDINPDLYNQLLNVEVPLTIALLYAATVTILNRTNKERGNKSWAFSKTKAFYAFVILHNVLLASYSFWTFAGMINAIRHSWPGWNGEYGLTGVVDTLCKINGPRGLGNAAAFSFSTGSWDVKNKAIRLLGGSPDSTDVGRIWNEGLAFYGWLFYLSKFYEVVDTLIVLAKGKNSSFLQTYHHAGAMLCMWAGVRYMSPPIWMFVLINSGIHGLMVCYSYFALLRQILVLTCHLVYLLHALRARGPNSHYSKTHNYFPTDRPIHFRHLLCSRTSLHRLFHSRQHAISIYIQHLKGPASSNVFYLIGFHVRDSICRCSKLGKKARAQSCGSRRTSRERAKQGWRAIWG